MIVTSTAWPSETGSATTRRTPSIDRFDTVASTVRPPSAMATCERLGARARLAELDRDDVVKLVGGHRRDQQLVAAARRDLAHLIARQPLAGDEDHARRRVVLP